MNYYNNDYYNVFRCQQCGGDIFSMCCVAAQALDRREPITLFWAPEEVNSPEKVDPYIGVYGQEAAKRVFGSRPIYPFASSSGGNPPAEMLRRWYVRAIPAAEVEKALREKGCATEALADLTGWCLPKTEAQNYLAMVPGSHCWAEPPPGVEYQNTGNFIPGGVWYWRASTLCTHAEETEWLDG